MPGFATFSTTLNPLILPPSNSPPPDKPINPTNGSLAEQCWGTTDVTSMGYQDAGNWVGVSFFVQAIGSMIWAPFIPMFKNLKVAYVVSLLIGAVGFISMLWITNEYVVLFSFLLVGAAWAAMLALPFTLFTNALQGHPRLGTYLHQFYNKCRDIMIMS